MGSRFYLRTLLLCLISSSVRARSQLQIPLDMDEWDEQLENDVDYVFGTLGNIRDFLGCYYFITYTGTFDLRPSLEQRLMEHFSVPTYTVASNQGPLHHHYPNAESLVVTLFSGLDDPTLTALNDTELSEGSKIFCFLYMTPRTGGRLWTRDHIREFFTWCWERDFVFAFLFLRGEYWAYYYFTDITIMKASEIHGEFFKKDVRSHGYRFLVQAANDPPTIFMHNSTDQADVIGGGNISLSGPIGLLVVEFMRYLNASMEVLPIQQTQSSNYEILEVASDRRVDMVANLVENSSFPFSPVLMSSQICLVVPSRRKIPLDRYFDQALAPYSNWYTLVVLILVFVIKHIAHRRRSLAHSFFNTIRFGLGMPLPGGQLERLPLADKIIEVYCLLMLGALIGACGSLLSSALTTGIYYPPITDVESMRASGLRIMTGDPTVVEAFRDNRLPRSLLDLVDVVDEATLFHSYTGLNDSTVYTCQTPNWQSYSLYQARLKHKPFSLTGPKLCSEERALRVPISPNSPQRFLFGEYFRLVFESGLQQKWLHMGFHKYRETYGITKLPREAENEFKPLSLSFYTFFFKICVGGLVLSTLVFIMEVLYKRYHG